MWPDNETDQDFLNFSGVAETTAEIIVQAQGRPISIGVSGAWGAGKSSLLRLIRRAIGNRSKEFVFVEFNAWLYQGYDDARAALLDVIAETLTSEAERRESGVDKARELLRRVDWLRLAKLAAVPALALAFGIPPVGLVAEAINAGKALLGGKADEEAVTEAGGTAQKVVDATERLMKERPDSSPPKEIHAIRECFEQALLEMGVTLVVLIDDLDRCLPQTTVSTLEAIRLFLFLDHTAFVIAADEAMIKHAVRKHFDGLDDAIVTNYFDKLIQIPVHVPPLGTLEVRAYMMLLYIQNSSLPDDEKNRIRVEVCRQLGQSWRGGRVDRAFMQTICENMPADLVARLDAADRLAPIMTTASQIHGNPRLIKRFMNAVSLRMAVAEANGVGVDEAVLAKMLLFERCAVPAAYSALTSAISRDGEGKPRILGDWETSSLAGAELKLDPPWNDSFIREWLTLPPRLSELDLRGVLYVCRDHAPLITPGDRLSSEGAEVLAAILQVPETASVLCERMRQIPHHEMTIIMDRVLERARQIQEWGTPPILDACIAVATADPSQCSHLEAFLRERPASQIRPSIVPRIADEPWAESVFNKWRSSGVAAPVIAAIAHLRG